MSYNNSLYISNQNLNLLDEIENQIQNITGLPDLRSIDDITIPSSAWNYVAELNQDLSSSSSPIFEAVTLNNGIGTYPNNTALTVTGNILPGSPNNCNIGWYSNYFGSIFSDNIYGTLGTVSQPINILPDLNSVQGVGIPSTNWNYLANMDQNVNTSSGPTFDHVTCGNIFGQIQGIQTGITSLPSLNSIKNVSIPATSWNYVSTMNQNVSSTGSPTFVSINTTNLTVASITGVNSIDGYSFTNFNYLSGINQGLSTTNSPNFSSLAVTNGVSAQTVTTNQVLSSIGSYSNPSYTFSSYNNYGLNCDGTNLVGIIGGSPVLNINSSGIIPYNGNSINLGSSSKYFQYGYINNLYGQLASTTQNNIQSLPALTGIQSTTIGSGVWPYVSTMNQNLATSNSPSFVSCTTTSQFLGQNGGYKTPTFSFTNHNQSGMYCDGSGNLFFTVNQSPNLEIGSQIICSVDTLPQVTNTTNLGNSSYKWSNVYGTNLYGTIGTSAQPNITSLGTLTSLTTSGSVTTGNISNPNSSTAGVVGNQLYFYQEETINSSFSINSGSGTISNQPTITCTRIGSCVTITLNTPLTFTNTSGVYFSQAGLIPSNFCPNSGSNPISFWLPAWYGTTTPGVGTGYLDGAIIEIYNSGSTYIVCTNSGSSSVTFGANSWYVGPTSISYNVK